MAYYEFPHTRNYDTDLGYLIDKTDANTKQIDSINETIESLNIDTIDSRLTKVETSTNKNTTDITEVKSDVVNLNSSTATNTSDIISLKVDNETNELNIANNSAEITKLKNKDYVTEIRMENSATVTFNGGKKVDGVQTFTATVTGSVPANLTENLAYANDQTTPLVSSIGSRDIIEQDEYIANAISVGNINNGASNTANIPVSKFNKNQFSKDDSNIISINSSILDIYETKVNANATFATNDELQALSSAKQDKLTFDTEDFSVSNDTVSIKDSIFDNYATKNQLDAKANTTDVANTYATKSSLGTQATYSLSGTTLTITTK